MAGYWQAPRALARLLTTGELKANEWTLLMFVAVSGADRPDGFETTNAFLADALHVSDSTIRRALRALRAHGFVDFEPHAGRLIFTVHTTAALAALAALGEPRSRPRSQPRSQPRSPETEDVTEVASVTGTTEAPHDPASADGSRASKPRSRPRFSTGETETETETENRQTARLAPLPPEQALENPRFGRLLEAISDADERTVAVLRRFEKRGLPEAAFARALESLRKRRARPGPKLVSEKKYVVATLREMCAEGQYGQERTR